MVQELAVLHEHVRLVAVGVVLLGKDDAAHLPRAREPGHEPIGRRIPGSARPKEPCIVRLKQFVFSRGIVVDIVES